MDSVWFAESFPAAIGEITLAGTVAEYPIPFTWAASGVGDLVLDREESVWFTVLGEPYVRIGLRDVNTSGFQLFSFPNVTGEAQHVTRGPDGNVWVTVQNESSGALGRISVLTGGGTFVTVDGPLRGITGGPDGRLWTGDDTHIRAFTTSFVESVYSIGELSGMSSITSGAGSLWFTTENNVSRILTNGTLVSTFAGSSDETVGLQGIVLGLDGALYFANPSDPALMGRLTTSGALTEYAPPTTDGQPQAVTRGSDGNIWFTEQSGKIGRLCVHPSCSSAP